MVSLTRIGMQQTVSRHQRLDRLLARAEARVASGERLERGSEAPADWAETRRIDRQTGQMRAVADGIGIARARAAGADRTLANITDRLARARELLVAAGGTAGAGRSAYATEIAAIRTDIAAALVATHDGGTLFDGASPLMLPLADGRTVAVAPQAAAVATLPDGSTLDAALADAALAAGGGNAADLAASLDAITNAIGHLADQQARQGLRLRALDDAEAELAAAAVPLAERRSAIADTDVAETAVEMNALLLQRDAARAMLARMTRETLFDLLR